KLLLLNPGFLVQSGQFGLRCPGGLSPASALFERVNGRSGRYLKTQCADCSWKARHASQGRQAAEGSQDVEERHLSDARVGRLRGLQPDHLLVEAADGLGVVQVAQRA